MINGFGTRSRVGASEAAPFLSDLERSAARNVQAPEYFLEIRDILREKKRNLNLEQCGHKRQKKLCIPIDCESKKQN